MSGRPAGATVAITYDMDVLESDGPSRGDLLVSFHRRTESIGTIYLVLVSRQVRSRVHPRRFSLRCMKLERKAAAEHLDEGVTVFPLFWYPRKRKRCW